MFAYVCTYVVHVYTHVCFNRTRGVRGHIFVFQRSRYVCLTCTLCALIARDCVAGVYICVYTCV